MRKFSARRGQALVMVTMSLVAMFGIIGLVVDLGWMRFTQRWAGTAADAAAIAAAQRGLDIVGDQEKISFACGSGVTCQGATGCSSTPTSNLTNACQFAAQHGFTDGGKGGRQSVTVTANNTSPPPTAAGVDSFYWVTVRAAENVPQLFSAVLGNTWGTSAAQSTAAVVEVIVPGSLYALDRENDAAPNGNGVGLFLQGNSTITAGSGAYIASAANGTGGNYVGEAGGGGTLSASAVWIREGGAVDNPGNFTPTPENGFSDGSSFRDPMRNKGQPPPPTLAQAPAVEVPGGTINGDCASPTVLNPGSYFAVDNVGGCKGAGCPTVATGDPVRITGCVIFSAGGGNFANYVFYGGANFDSPGTTATFDPGRYVFAGAEQNNPVFVQSNGVTLTDQTPLSGGASVPNTDAGEIFIFTNTNYPGLQLPAKVQNIASTLDFGVVDLQMGNNASSLINLHGLNPDSLALPPELRKFAPTVFWQDQQNSTIKYTADGNIDTTSCGPGYTLSNPCPNTDPDIEPDMFMQAHPNLHLYGVVYQPRGANLTIQGNGNLTSPMMLISGSVNLQGGPNVTLQNLNRNLRRKVVALVQ